MKDQKFWLNACPHEKYSSLHQLALGVPWFQKKIFVELNANLHVPLDCHPQACMTFHTQDAITPPGADCCFSISHLNRWRANISSFNSINEYLANLSRWHRCNYSKSEKTFRKYGCEVKCIRGDFSLFVDEAFALYCNVARRYNRRMYDIQFFRAAAKRDDYQLLAAWFEGKMIGMFLLQDETPTLHSGCSGFDYLHSSKSYAYSWLHYEMIRLAIEEQKYQFVDAGITADASKQMIGFECIPSRMDIYTKCLPVKYLLRLAASCLKVTLSPDEKLQCAFRFGRRKNLITSSSELASESS